jgi:hypothetical protein
MLELLPDACLAAARLLAVILVPPALLGLALRSLEQLITSRLASRLGRRWVLITGWLGVPVHELSHVLACWLFMHRVERVVFFDPDPRAASLGRVEHSWAPLNPWAQIGRLVIGVAPLIGGAAALVGLTHWLGPGVVLEPPVDPTAGIIATLSSLAADLGDMARAWWTTPRAPDGRTALWLFLCLSIGSHMAPSRADLTGSLAGLAVLIVAVIGVALALAMGGAQPGDPGTMAAALIAPLVALLSVALVLVSLCAVLVWLLTWPLPPRAPSD